MKERLKERIRDFLETFTTIMSGMTAGSLWFTDSGTWKITLPIALLGLGLLRIFDSEIKK